MNRQRWGVVLAVAALALGAAACGGDDDESGTSSVPDITVPKGEAETVTEEATTAPDTDAGGTTFDPNKPDSPTNDVPPEPGTPEGKFEEFCKQNPGACG